MYDMCSALYYYYDQSGGREKSERKRPQISHQYLSSHIKKPSQKKIASHKNPADSILSNLVDDKMQK
jgi:hypothetical protein